MSKCDCVGVREVELNLEVYISTHLDIYGVYEGQGGRECVSKCDCVGVREVVLVADLCVEGELLLSTRNDRR